MNFLRRYLAAVQRFTRVPVTGSLAQWMGLVPQPLQASAAHFPGVGWLVGLAACVSFAAIGLMLQGNTYSPLATAVASTIATVLLTGGLHEHGLARFAQGLRADDSQAQSDGTLALVLGLAAKLALLSVLAAQSRSAVLLALVCAHVTSRFWPLLIVHVLPPVGDTDAIRRWPFGQGIDQRELAIAGAWCAPALLLALFVQGIAFIVVALLLSSAGFWWMKRTLRRRLQGFSIDSLGATQQVGEGAFYFGAAIAWNMG